MFIHVAMLHSFHSVIKTCKKLLCMNPVTMENAGKKQGEAVTCTLIINYELAIVLHL